MNIEDARSSIQNVVRLLRSNQFSEDADNLEELFSESMKSSSESNGAIEQIKAMCSIKWLGDYSIKEVDLDTWLRLLEEVKVAIE